ncbi:MAG: PAS domain S-box protein [Bryobacteraceae bacterium]
MSESRQQDSAADSELAGLRARIAELEASERRYRRMVESVSEGIWLTDPDGRTTYVNQSLADMLGYSPEELLGKTPFDLIHEEDAERARYRFQLRKQGLKGRFEYRYRRKDTSIVWASLTASPLIDEQNCLVGLLALVTDISDRKRSEEALRLSELRFRTVAEATTDLVYEWGLATGRVEWFGDIEATLGYAPGEFEYSHENWFNHIHPEDRTRVEAALNRQLAVQEKFCAGYRVRRKDGTYLYWEERGIALSDSQGIPYLWIGACTDVTESREAEARIADLNCELSRRVEEYEALLDAIPIGIAVAHDPECREVQINRAFAAMVGLDSPACGLRVSPESEELTFAAFREGMRLTVAEFPLCVAARPGMQASEFEIDVQHPAGRQLNLFGYACPLRNAEGGVRGSLAVFVDVTERRRAEREIERSNADLQQFAYVTSHDLQEPLRTLASYSQLLDQNYGDRLDGDARAYLHQIIGSVERMRALILDLLAYSRVITPGSAPFSSVDSNGVLAWTLMNLETAIRDNRAVVTSDPLPCVHGDQTQLVQLFQNLLSNAIKYRTEQDPRIHLSAERRGSEWLFSVRDNGIGIDPKYHERIFGLFKRLHGRDVPGSGLGLSICQRIVEKHGGRIWLESEPGAGATFYFTLLE